MGEVLADAPVENPEEGGVQEGMAGSRVFVCSNVGGEVLGPCDATFEEEGVGRGDEEDGRNEDAELVVVLVGSDGDETILAADFLRLAVGETIAFSHGEVELDA